MFVKSLEKNPKNVAYDGVDTDETILYVLRQSILVNIPWIIFASVLIAVPTFLFPLLPDFISIRYELGITLFWYLVTFGFIFQCFINWFFNVYIISDKKIVDVDFHGILYKHISEAPLKSIEDITSEVSSAFGVIFNIGHVYVQTAAEKREFDFSNVDNPSKIRDIISDLVAKKRGGH